MTWHVDIDLLRGYAAGATDEVAAWSVEQHVAGCSPCRDALTDLRLTGSVTSTERRLDAVWDRIELSVEAPARPLLDRVLVALGVPPHVARLLAATPSLSASWLLAVAAVLSTAAAATLVGYGPSGESAPLLFLVVAPLAPLAGVAVAYGPRVDPTYEIGVVAPLSSVRLLYVRATAVMAVSFLLAAVAALLLPTDVGVGAAAWMLPALAVSVGCLAASTWTSPLVAAAGIGAAWIALVTGAEVASDTVLVAFRQHAQIGWTVLAAAAAVVLSQRSARLDPAARR